MFKIRYFAMGALVAVTMAFAITASVADDQDASKEKEVQLIQVLQSDAPKADKAITCKGLAIYGTKDAVPALAALLPDEQLTSWARTALEVIPGPEADEALREAVGKVQGRVLIGVINSIGFRRDAAAVESLTAQMNANDAEVASAAAAALGKIGDAAATAALQRALAEVPDAVRSAVAEGCIQCAERLLVEGKATEAAELYDKVRNADVPKQRRIEAIRGAIIARQSAGIPLLVEQLRSTDKTLFGIGLSTARELTGREVTEALVGELAGAAPERQALLVTTLAERNDPAALPALLSSAASGPKSVRIAAADVLRRVGNITCVAGLLDVAQDADEEVAQAARAAIEGLPGEDVDADLAARLPQATGPLRLVLIQVAGQRRIVAAVPALLKAADDSDTKIRTAALTALGSTVTADDLSVLIGRVVAPQRDEETPVAQQSLRAACIRMPDGDACATQLTSAMSRASTPAKCAILEILGTMGGAKALETVGSAAKDENPELQDAASRLLGEWMTVDAGPVLLDLAKTASDNKYKIRGLRGYIRLVRQFVIPDEQRVEMCRAALDAAERDAERELVLEVMERYPSVDMLRLAVELAKVPALKNDAARISLVIAQKIGGSADVQQLLAQVGHDPVKIEIVQAQYGAGTKLKDVTEILRKHVRDFPLIVLPSPSYNAALGGDPAPSVVKQLKIQYRMDGKSGEATFAENATIMLPTP